MMNFKKHEIAIELQKTLKEGFYQTLKIDWTQLDDITMIYDQPIRLCLDFLSLYRNHAVEPTLQQTLINLQNKYQNLNHKVLTSLQDDEIIPLIGCIQKITPSIMS